MSDRLTAAAAANTPSGEDSPVHRLLVAEAVSQLGWGTMPYQCERCGYEAEVWLSLGVEGPPSLKGKGLYVPAPFTTRCMAWPLKADATEEERATMRDMTSCDGLMRHIDWNRDRRFEPRLVPDGAPRFVLDDWYDSARLLWTEDALVAARRFHREQAHGG